MFIDLVIRLKFVKFRLKQLLFFMIHQINRIHAGLVLLFVLAFILLSSFKQEQAPSLSGIGPAIQKYVSLQDTAGLLLFSDSLKKKIQDNFSDSTTLAEVSYYIGVCKLLVNQFGDATSWFRKSVEIKKRLAITDNHYANGIFNLGVCFNLMGDFKQASNYWLDYIKGTSGMYGENSSEIAEAYSALIGASIELKDFHKFTDYTFKALGILNINKNALQGIQLANLYSIIGTGYARIDDYAKARIYLEKAESVISQGYMISDEDYINLINSMAITYNNLGMVEKADEYFNKGIELAVSNNSFLAYNMINSYVIDLGKSGKIKEGEYYLTGLLNKAVNVYGKDSRYYIEVLKNYATFLSNYTDEQYKALELYSECMVYVKMHPEDGILRDQIFIVYALALEKNGEYIKALEKIQELLFGGKEKYSGKNLYKNPIAESLPIDRRTLRVLQAKYNILWDIYEISGEQGVLEAAAGTSELAITLIDKIRINVSEEESRVVLGTHFRESYLQAIRSFELCYRKSGERRFLEKTFEFAEKSKVAGLLAATRELNAIQFHIPPETAEMEKKLQKEISVYNSRISKEIEIGTPDKNLLSTLNEKLLLVVKARDSLVITFEHDYPEYYSIKYNNKVPSLNEIPSITGRNNNYLNYVMSDSVLYIFLVNRKYQKILTFKTDSSFFNKLRTFRLQLSKPSTSKSARQQFNDFQETGLYLYKILIDPVKQYLISGNIMISPDNLLSYIPFETLLSSKYSGNELLYRKLHYIMSDYNISYVYSATFMQESVVRNNNKAKDLIAFAPVYSRAINTDSLFMKRQSDGVLYALPYSRQEAEYVAKITNGKLYLDNEASESTFKREAGNYDIIHLAMHTYLNDMYPMNSAMLFSQKDDSPEDGLLNTFEVYGIPLKASMVVLSSCNTGYGKLSSGEGILSLARGFLYSGSQSVVMSLWEIEDRSGTDIIEMFYDNLLKGKSKSNALKKARTTYLEEASQLRSHPYYWSTLVIYGNNAPISERHNKLIMILIILISGSVLIYVLKRRYS